MINIILIVLLIHYSLYLLIKPKNLNLSCGIFGWFGKNPKKFNKDKFDKLGIFNVERGRTSCGVSIDGDLFLGIDNEKLYTDFIKGRNFQPKLFPYALGHTRAASVGNAVTLDNVHPFGFGDLKNNDDLYEFLGVHNGTIYNADDLARKYGVEVTETKTIFNQHHVKQQKTRTKIDSELMLEILYTSKTYKVLSEYNGTAAMVFVNLNEPNVVYIWKGASKSFTYAAATLTEERPLFYFKETRNSLYISSIEDSLLTIGGTKNETVFTFDENTIYKITDGNVDKAEKIKVSRHNALQKETTTVTYPKSNQSHINSSFRRQVSRVSQNCRIKEEKSESIKLVEEKTVRTQDEYGSRLYFNKLRYWRNGHLAGNGIYMWIPGWGFKFLTAESTDVAETYIETFVGKPFINGEFDLELETNRESYVPFPNKKNITDNIHYFIHGVNLKTELDFHTFLAKTKKYQNYEIPYKDLSYCSKHPVCNYYKNEPSYIYNEILFEGKPYTGSFCLLGSEKIYTVKKGDLISAVENPFRTLELGFAPESTKTEEDKTPVKSLLPVNHSLKAMQAMMGFDDEPININESSIKNAPKYEFNLNDRVLGVRDEEYYKGIITSPGNTSVRVLWDDWNKEILVDSKTYKLSVLSPEEDEKETQTMQEEIQQLNDIMEEELSESLIQVENVIELIEESSVEGEYSIARKLLLLKKIKKQFILLTDDKHFEKPNKKDDSEEKYEVKRLNEYP